MLKFIKNHGLEGAVAKRSDSVYQPGQRTGLWSKYRVTWDKNLWSADTFPATLALIPWWWVLPWQGPHLRSQGEGRPGACNPA
jgi:hypothetical protein